MTDEIEIEQKILNIANIKENPKNVRIGAREDLSSLMESIKQRGVLQPIGVQKTNGDYLIIFGHRRFNAVRKLGLKTIRCNIYSGLTEKDILIMNTIENIHQKTITPIELGQVAKELYEKEKMSFKEIASRLSISADIVRNAYDAHKFVPKKYLEQSGFAKRNAKEFIPVSTLNQIARLSRQYRLNRKAVNKIIEVSKQGNISKRQVQSIPIMLKTENMSMQQAVKKALQYSFLDVVVGVETEILENLQKTQNKTKGQIAYEIVSGKIKLPKNKYIIRPSERG